MKHMWLSLGPSAGILKASKLARIGLKKSIHFKLALASSSLTAAFFTFAAIYLGAYEQGNELGNVPAKAAVVAAWLSATLIAWWAASDRARLDREQGITHLAESHGLSEKTLLYGRAIGTTQGLFAIVFFSTLPVLIASAAASPSMSIALYRTLSVLPLGLFSLGVAIAGGATAIACGVIAPRRGRTLFAAFILVPWFLEGSRLTRSSASSVPSLLGSIADSISRVGGGM